MCINEIFKKPSEFAIKRAIKNSHPQKQTLVLLKFFLLLFLIKKSKRVFSEGCTKFFTPPALTDIPR